MIPRPERMGGDEQRQGEAHHRNEQQRQQQDLDQRAAARSAARRPPARRPRRLGGGRPGSGGAPPLPPRASTSWDAMAAATGRNSHQASTAHRPAGRLGQPRQPGGVAGSAQAAVLDRAPGEQGQARAAPRTPISSGRRKAGSPIWPRARNRAAGMARRGIPWWMGGGRRPKHAGRRIEGRRLRTTLHNPILARMRHTSMPLAQPAPAPDCRARTKGRRDMIGRRGAITTGIAVAAGAARAQAPWPDRPLRLIVGIRRAGCRTSARLVAGQVTAPGPDSSRSRTALAAAPCWRARLPPARWPMA
jgi:hypothetical protein